MKLSAMTDTVVKDVKVMWPLNSNDGEKKKKFKESVTNTVLATNKK